MKEKNTKNRDKMPGGKVLMAVAAIAVLAVAALFLPVFNITAVNVFGNSLMEKSDIIKASGISVGKHILKVSTNEAEDGISKIPYIDSVKVKRQLPNIINITVVESIEAAYVPFSGEFVGIDLEGKVLEVKAAGDKYDFPIIYGLQITGYEIGRKISPADEHKERFNALTKILAQLELNELLGSVKSIEISDTENMRLLLSNEATANIGNADKLSYKISFLKSVLENDRNINGGLIDLTNPDKVVYSQINE